MKNNNSDWIKIKELLEEMQELVISHELNDDPTKVGYVVLANTITLWKMIKPKEPTK